MKLTRLDRQEEENYCQTEETVAAEEEKGDRSVSFRFGLSSLDNIHQAPCFSIVLASFAPPLEGRQLFAAPSQYGLRRKSNGLLFLPSTAIYACSLRFELFFVCCYLPNAIIAEKSVQEIRRFLNEGFGS